MYRSFIITDGVFFHQLKSQTIKTNISEIKERNKDKLFQVSNFSLKPIPSLSILFNNERSKKLEIEKTKLTIVIAVLKVDIAIVGTVFSVIDFFY